MALSELRNFHSAAAQTLGLPTTATTAACATALTRAVAAASAATRPSAPAPPPLPAPTAAALAGAEVGAEGQAALERLTRLFNAKQPSQVRASLSCGLTTYCLPLRNSKGGKSAHRSQACRMSCPLPSPEITCLPHCEGL